MFRRFTGTVLVLGTVFASTLVVWVPRELPAEGSSPPDSGRGALDATRTLVRRLKSSGRAQATLERTIVDPLSGEPESVTGQLVLELPDRASLLFRDTGEHVTMRSDGGEWLQPQLGQMIVLGPKRAAIARRWWRVMLPDSDERVDSRRLGPGRFLLVVTEPDGSFSDSAWVQLDEKGLPSRLEISEDYEARTLYRFEKWRFSRPKGRAAFVLEAPVDFEVVRFP